MRLFRFVGPLGLVTVALLVAACSVNQSDKKKIPAAVLDYDILLSVPDRDIGFREAVQPVLDRRCVVCHGCFDAPCQLKLSSYAGLTAGRARRRSMTAHALPRPRRRACSSTRTAPPSGVTRAFSASSPTSRPSQSQVQNQVQNQTPNRQQRGRTVPGRQANLPISWPTMVTMRLALTWPLSTV